MTVLGGVCVKRKKGWRVAGERQKGRTVEGKDKKEE